MMSDVVVRSTVEGGLLQWRRGVWSGRLFLCLDAELSVKEWVFVLVL